jgi:hypothetical protein
MGRLRREVLKNAGEVLGFGGKKVVKRGRFLPRIDDTV